MSQRVLNQQN